jgi:hypothetical protein
MPKYRIYTSRFDINETVYKSFTANDDKAAKKEFKKISGDPSNAWDRMRMVCVETVEKTRKVAVNENLQKVLDS